MPSCAFSRPCRPRCSKVAPARASPATPASGRLGPGGSAAARGPCDGPHPGTGSGPGRCEWPPAAAHPTVRASARGAPGHIALGAANSPPRVERRARPLPRSTHPLETLAPSRRRGGRSAHRRDLRVAKGRRHSAARARSRNSSISIDSSPMWRLAASSSAASGSPACAFRPSSRPASARVPRLQAIELYPESRETVSSDRRAAAAEPRPVSGSRSTATGAKARPQPPRRRRRLQSPSCSLRPRRHSSLHPLRLNHASHLLRHRILP